LRRFPYHAKMESSIVAGRIRNDGCRTKCGLLVGTIRLWAGHHQQTAVAGGNSLVAGRSPIESEYYQEAGPPRAGRASADCVLLWQGNATRSGWSTFIGKISDDAERERSFERKRVISRFADSHGCRTALAESVCTSERTSAMEELRGHCDNGGAQTRVRCARRSVPVGPA